MRVIVRGSAWSAACRPASSAAASRFLLLFVVLLRDNYHPSISLGAHIATLFCSQRLLADNVVDLCQDLLEGLLHIGALQGTGLNEGEALLFAEGLQRKATGLDDS